MAATAKGLAVVLLICALTGCNYPRMFYHMDDEVHHQEQFFYRLDYAGNYVPDPMTEKLDMDDPVLRADYRNNSKHFQERLDAMHVDINTVLVKPDPAPIRILAVEEASPALLWRLYLITGNDTAQLLEDGIHLRRQGFPEKILGGAPSLTDNAIHSEMGRVLWRPNGRGSWSLDDNGGSVVWHVSITTIDDLRKHQNFGPLFRLDCNALQQFTQPLHRGESTREITLKVDVPVSPSERKPPTPTTPPVCQVDLLHGKRDFVESGPPSTEITPPPTPAPRTKAEDGSSSIVVDAKKMWTPTAISVKEGQVIRIEADGTVTSSTSRKDGAFRWVGPAGWGYEPRFGIGQYHLLLGHGSSYMCLAARIGDAEPFNASPVGRFTAANAGQLFLGVNDVVVPVDPEKYFRDNAGSFKVSITMEK